MYYVTNQKLIQYDIDTGNEEIIYSSGRNIYCLAISPDRQQLAFYEGPLDAGFNLKDLVLFTFSDRSLTTIWSSKEGEQFTSYSEPHWLNDGIRLMVSVSEIDLFEKIHTASWKYHQLSPKGISIS